MKPIQTGLIGFGFSGSTFHAPVIKAVPALEIDKSPFFQTRSGQTIAPGSRNHQELGGDAQRSRIGTGHHHIPQ